MVPSYQSGIFRGTYDTVEAIKADGNATLEADNRSEIFIS
jgi:hypothetical protein